MKTVTTPTHVPPANIPRNVTDVGTGQITATTTPQQISYVSSRRAAIKLTNLSSTEIFWGTNSGVSSTSGDLLPAGRGQWLSIPGGSAIFVITAGGSALMSWAEVFE